MCFTYPTGPSNLCNLPIETKRRLYAAQKAADKAVTFELDLDGEKKEEKFEVIPAAAVVDQLQSTEEDGGQSESPKSSGSQAA